MSGAKQAASAAILSNVQVLRAMAAFMVVAYHARLVRPVSQYISLQFGNAGVDIFFFISGFIIAHVSLRSDVGRPLAFLIKRAIRIAPLYWALTITLFLAAQFVPSLSGAGGQPDITMLIKSLMFVPYIDASGEAHPILFMGWTLNYEVFFYLIFASALILHVERTRLTLVSAVLLALTIAGLVLAPRDAIGATYTDALMLEFVVGMWMSVLYRTAPDYRLNLGARAALRAAACVAMALLIAGDYYWPTMVREIKWGGPAFAIVAAALVLERGGASLRRTSLLLLGEASYAVYLSHPFIIKAMSMVYARLEPGSSWAGDILVLMSVIVIVAITGIALHLLVEKPLIHHLRRWVMPSAPPSIATGELPVRDPRNA